MWCKSLYNSFVKCYTVWQLSVVNISFADDVNRILIVARVIVRETSESVEIKEHPHATVTLTAHETQFENGQTVLCYLVVLLSFFDSLCRAWGQKEMTACLLFGSMRWHFLGASGQTQGDIGKVRRRILRANREMMQSALPCSRIADRMCVRLGSVGRPCAPRSGHPSVPQPCQPTLPCYYPTWHRSALHFHGPTIAHFALITRWIFQMWRQSDTCYVHCYARVTRNARFDYSTCECITLINTANAFPAREIA